jgi:hypothetical protein
MPLPRLPVWKPRHRNGGAFPLVGRGESLIVMSEPVLILCPAKLARAGAGHTEIMTSSTATRMSGVKVC